MQKFIFIFLILSIATANGFSQTQISKKNSSAFLLNAGADTNKNSKSTFSATSNVHKVSFSLGMGLALLNNSSFNNYLRREIPYSTTDSIKSFNAGIEFFGGIEYVLSKNFSMKLDYSYAIRSATYSSPTFISDYNYDIHVHQSYLMAYYLMPKASYDLKFGIGAGYHLSLVDKQTSITTTSSFQAGGIGLRGEAIFAPYLSRNLQAYISGFLAGSFFGSLKDANGNYLTSPNSTEQVNLGGFGVGVRIGFAYIFK